MKADFEYHVNPDCVRLHLTVPLPWICDMGITRLDDAINLQDSKLTKQQSIELWKKLNVIEGVTKVSMGVSDRYSILLLKGKLFTWAQINPKILAAVQEAFPNDPVELLPQGSCPCVTVVDEEEPQEKCCAALAAEKLEAKLADINTSDCIDPSKKG